MMGDSSITSSLQRLAIRLDRDPGTPVEQPTESFWQVPRHSFADQQSDTLPKNTDVLIIGSGITGISIAQHLTRLNPSFKLTMLEARSAISGATGRNGGHIKAVPWVDYGALKEGMGRTSAMRLTKFRLAHLDALVEEASALGEAGQVGLVRRVEGVSAIFDEDVWKAAKSKLEAWLEDFPEQRGRWTIHEGDEELKKFGIANAHGCVKGPSGAAWPYRFLGVMLSKLLEAGQVTLETHTVVKTIRRVQSSDHPYEVDTSRGAISAKHVIHCTNGHAAHLLPYLQGKLWPLRGQMTVQSVSSDFPRLGASTSWSTMWAHGFDYITQSPAEDGSLYLGGGFFQGGPEKDEDLGNTDDSQLSAVCLEHLETVPGRAFEHGEGATVANKWTGIMGFTADGLPLVDRVPPFVSGREDGDQDMGGEWIAAGYNGYGMVHCWLAGKALAHMVCGREKDVLDWFPRHEFRCSRERLEQMTPEVALKNFLGLGVDSEASDLTSKND